MKMFQVLYKSFPNPNIRNEKVVEQLTQTLRDLYKCYVSEDATLVEVNPLILTDEEEIIALDAKVTLDDNVSSSLRRT